MSNSSLGKLSLPQKSATVTRYFDKVKQTFFDSACKYFYYQIFVDDCGKTEGAVDTGGLTRELLEISMRALPTLPIFSGPDHELHLVRSEIGECLHNILNSHPIMLYTKALFETASPTQDMLLNE